MFNHIIGLPVKNGKEHPIYDYELDVIDKIENHRNIWIKEGFRNWSNRTYPKIFNMEDSSQQRFRIQEHFHSVGTFFHHANELKVRMENLFRKKFPLNATRIKVY